MKYGAVVPVLNEWKYLPAVVGQLLQVCDRVLVLRGQTSLSGAPAILSPIPKLDSRVEIIEGTWASEAATRNAGISMLQDDGIDYVFIADSDEIFSIDALRLLQSGCLQGLRAISCRFATYWKSTEYRIDPPEPLVATSVVKSDVRFMKLRMIEGHQTAVNQMLMHHLSYVRTDDEVQEKLRLFAHAEEVLPGWFTDVWKAWDSNHDLENLHPTTPSAFKRAIPVRDEKLRGILERFPPIL